MTTTGPKMQLSGWLPNQDHDGLSRLTAELVERFEAAYADGSADPIQVVVVGVLSVETVRHHRDPEEHPPVLAVKLAAIEAATGRRADQLRWVLSALQNERAGGQLHLDGFDETVAAMLKGTDELPPPPPIVEEHDHRGGTSTNDGD